MSAALDGELRPAEAASLERHLGTCAACRADHADLADLHRTVRVREAGRVPDLVGPIMAAVELPRPRRTFDLEWARYALLAVALTQLIIALPALLLGQDDGASTHVARELGSFDVALASGLLLAAWQPRRATGLIPFGVALAFATLVVSLIDVVAGRAVVGGEAHHVLDIVGVALLCLVARLSVHDRRTGRIRLT
jgi:predicted anti-sigma-YlaC factor YlaD